MQSAQAQAQKGEGKPSWLLELRRLVQTRYCCSFCRWCCLLASWLESGSSKVLNSSRFYQISCSKFSNSQLSFVFSSVTKGHQLLLKKTLSIKVWNLEAIRNQYMFQFILEGPNSDLEVAVWPCCICTGSWPFLTAQPSSLPKHLPVVSGSSIDSDTKPHMRCFFCFNSYVRLNLYNQCLCVCVCVYIYAWTSQVALVVKNPAANADVGSVPGLGRSPGGGNGNPLHILAWRVPWTEEPGGLQSIGSQSQTRLKWVSTYVYILQFSSVQSLSHVRLFVTPWIAARQASLSITNSRSSLKLMSIELVMTSSHLILCRPLLLLPPIPPSIRVFSNESTLCMRWPKYLQIHMYLSCSSYFSDNLIKSLTDSVGSLC